MGEIGECWIPADMVRYSDPVIPLVLWPLAFVIGLFIAHVIDQHD